MKKNLLKFFLFITIVPMVLFSGCNSLTFDLSNEKADIPFSGTMDTRFGYENFYWGMSWDEMKKMDQYPLVREARESRYVNMLPERSDYSYFYGYEKKYSDGTKYYNKYGHGDVDSTEFFFYKGKLCSVVETLSIKNPSMEYLHQRYGDFSEENRVADFKNTLYLSKVYLNTDAANTGIAATLQIEISRLGEVTVLCKDPLVFNVIFNENKLRFLKDSRNLPANHWYLFGYIDGKEKLYKYTFFNKTEDNAFVIFQYSKSPVSSVLSSVKAGFSYKGVSVNGNYEIKTQTEKVEKKFDSKIIELSPYGKEFYYTYNSSESPRWMLDLIRSNDSLQIRHNDRISTFSLNGFNKILDTMGITPEELEFAIANEEF